PIDGVPLYPEQLGQRIPSVQIVFKHQNCPHSARLPSGAKLLAGEIREVVVRRQSESNSCNNIIHTAGRFRNTPNFGCASSFRVIPPTAVGGCFKLDLPKKRGPVCQSHPRQWVDRSSTAYRSAPDPLSNPTQAPVDRPSTAGRSPRSIHLQPYVTHRKGKGSCCAFL